MRCPWCNAEIPAGAHSCPKCDWVDRQSERRHDPVDIVAACLSLVPGLGHLYKGHLVLGGALLLVISPGVLGLVLAVVPATLGLSLVILPLYLAGIAIHASQAPDLRDQLRNAHPQPR